MKKTSVIFIILFNITVCFAHAQTSIQLNVIKIRQLCKKKDYSNAFDLLKKTYNEIQDSHKTVPIYDLLRMYNSISYFEQSYRQDNFFISLQKRIDVLHNHASQMKYSEGVAAELAKFWYYSNQQKLSLNYLNNLEHQNIIYIHGNWFVWQNSYPDILDHEIRNNDLFSALKILCQTKGYSRIYICSGLVIVPFRIICLYPDNFFAWFFLFIIVAVCLILLTLTIVFPIWLVKSKRRIENNRTTSKKETEK